MAANKTIGLIGAGAIGSFLAKKLGKRVVWACDADVVAAGKRMKEAGSNARIVKKPERGVELIVECASQEAVPILLETLEYADAMILSVGALRDVKLLSELEAAAKRNGRTIYIPSGAVGGLDALKSCKPSEVLLETRKPPASLGRKDSKETVIFEGSASEACRQFPKNVNVSATLALAGIGFEKTRVRVVSDPNAKGNSHRVIVKGEAGTYEFKFENEPLKENSKTSALAAYAALRVIEEMDKQLQIR